MAVSLDPKMQQRGDEYLKIGMRVRLSPLGLQRCPKLGCHTGVVLNTVSRSSLRILLDGQKVPSTLHASYIEPE
jgi:hypothetical protein